MKPYKINCQTLERNGQPTNAKTWRLGDLQITTDDWSLDMIKTMSGGDLRAVEALTDILKKGDFIDPNARNGGLLAVLLLDRFEIYDGYIWVLYNHLCGKSVVKTIALLRSAQMELENYTPEALKQSIKFVNHRIEVQLDIDSILRAVRDKLPDFRPYYPT